MRFLVPALLLATITCRAQLQSAFLPRSHALRNEQIADSIFAEFMQAFRNREYGKAADQLKGALPYAKAAGKDSLTAHYLTSIANAYILNQEAPKAFPFLAEARSYLNRTPRFSALLMKYFIYNGMAFGQIHSIDSALYYYHEAEKLNERENPGNNWIVYTQIGLMFQEALENEEAEKYFRKAYAITSAGKNRVEHGIVLYRLQSLYYSNGNVDKYALLMHEQEVFYRGHNYMRTDPTHSMTFYAWAQEPFEKKVDFMEKLKHSLLAAGNSSEAAQANLYLAEFYRAANRSEEGLQYILQNDSLLDARQPLINLLANEKLKYRLLKDCKLYEMASASADKLIVLKDSIATMQQGEKLLELEAKYESERKEKDIALLHAENLLNTFQLQRERELKEFLQQQNLHKDSQYAQQREYSNLLSVENRLREKQLRGETQLKEMAAQQNLLQEKALTKESRLRNILLIAASLLLLSGAMIFGLYRRQRIKNQLISRQSDDLRMLMKEIHHRVKNNLQVISSLLDLQSLNIEDEHAAEAIRDSRNRVYSMALIHQNLYREGQLTGIEMPAYIDKLTDSLFDSYRAAEKGISLEKRIEPILLDIEQVIPLGLVLNELMTNALKYGFEGRPGGKITVVLQRQGTELLLEVKDNGNGFPGHMNIYQSNSFGFKMIKAFAQKLKARLEWFNDQGACVRLHIRKFQPVT